MTRALVTLILLFATTAGARAVECPWQTSAEHQPPEYCKGFVVGGLASKQVSGPARTELWLAWNYMIRSGALEQTAATEEFQSGLAQFQNVADASAAASVVEQANGSCGLGRTGHQITGW